MSYSHYAKNLLCGVNDRHKCCDAALLYGLLINAGVFSEKKIKYSTENSVIASKIEALINSVLKFEVKFKETANRTHQLNIGDVKLINKLFKKFGYVDLEGDLRQINDKVFSCSRCRGAFMRGIFISCGTVSEPKNGYHLEISLNSEKTALGIKGFLSETENKSGESGYTGSGFKYIRRRKAHILYLKGSEKIEDFLYYINAAKISFDIMEVKILKDVRNNVNRINNLENANLKKISKAAAEQIEAINAIIKDGRFESMPEELKQTARLRLENIELSLQEIGEMSEPKLTKSGVNHRIKKLIELSKISR